MQKADQNKGTIKLSALGVQGRGNLCGGILGILFWTLLLVLLVIKSISVFGKRTVVVQSFTKQDQTSLTFDTRENPLALYVVQVGETVNVPINYETKYNYGLEVLFITYELWVTESDQIDNDVHVYQMIPCAEDPQLFCLPPKTQILTPQCRFEEVGIYGCRRSWWYDIMVRKCDEIDHPTCAPELGENITSLLAFMNNKLDVFQLNDGNIISQVNKAIGALSRTYFTENYQFLLEMQFNKAVITTDDSIFPYFSIESTLDTWYYADEYEIEDDRSQYAHHRYVNYRISRSRTCDFYRRSFPKVDAMLGQILGFMGLISSIIYLLCAGYNQHLMNEYIRSEKSGHHEESHEKVSICSYYLSEVKKIARCCSKKQKRSASLLEDNDSEVSEEVSSTIDVLAMYKDIKQLKGALLEAEQKIKELSKAQISNSLKPNKADIKAQKSA